MIINRTPLRISFFGGGTDYPDWYRENGGAVIAVTINKYNYVICRHLPPFFDYNYRVRYRNIEETKTIDEIDHPSVRECLRFCNIDGGIEIQHNSDLPAMSGLGSSSSFTVGLLNSLYALKGQITTKRKLALDAIHIEQKLIGENVGSQDQTSTAFGGMNLIRFGGEQQVDVHPITIGANKVRYLENRLMLFFTGFSRIASNIAVEQVKEIPNKSTELNDLMKIVDEACLLLNGDENKFDHFGALLGESWKIKRSLSNFISNPSLDEIYNKAMKAGALGGKLLGAGGGGFMLFYVPVELQEKVRGALSSLLYVPFKMENGGSQIIYYAPHVEF